MVADIVICYGEYQLEQLGFWYIGEMMGKVNKKVIFQVWVEIQEFFLNVEVFRDG